MNERFFLGLGLGMAGGALLGHVLTPKPKKNPARQTAERYLKNVGGVIDEISDSLRK